MRIKVIAIAVVAFLAAGAAGLSAQSADDAKFNKFQDGFWDTYFKFFPTEGTIQGFTKYNDRLEDMRSGNIEKFLDGMDGFNQELVTKIDKTKLSPEMQIEYDMIRDFIDQEVMKLENSVFRIDNPLYYNSVFLQSLRSLMMKTSPALDARLKSAAERAKQIAGLVKNAKDNLKTPPREYTEAAIRQLPAILDFYRTEIPRLSGSSAALQAEIGKAITALEDYQRFLQNELLNRSSGNFRLGEFHLRLLRMKSAGSLPIMEEIVPRSLADYNNIRKAMGLVCLPYFSVMYPDIDPDQLAAQKGADAALAFVIQSVLEKLKESHPAQADLLTVMKDTAAAIKTFIAQNGLLDLPSDNLAIESMPPFCGAFSRFHLAGPGAFESSGSFTLFADPIPAGMAPEKVNSLLEEYTNYYLHYLTLQEIYPGMFVPSLLLREASSPIKRMHSNEALIRGWSLDLGEMLVFAGFQGYNLRERLNQLKLQLKNVIEFQMDINIHQGTYTKEKVVEYMMRGGFMTQAEAETSYEEIVLNPGDAALAYIGRQEILEMEKEYKSTKGEAFSKKEFLQKVLSFGPIPLRALKMKMAQ